MKVTYVSHASLKITGEFGTLISDPWILNEPVYAMTTWKFPAAVMSPKEVTKDLDYLYLSHAHEDHLHIPSLDHFRRDIPVLLADYTSNNSLRAFTIERTFRDLGFHNLILLKPWETIQLGPKTRFTLIPACKMKWWDWENSGFVLEENGQKILNMNDCPSDPELYKQLNETFGTIDLGMVQYSGVSMFPGCYRMPLSEMEAASKKKKVGWVQQKNMIELLQVKRIMPIAGDFCWLDDEMFHCNLHNRATPKLFEDFVRSNYPEKNIEVLILNPTDEWTAESGIARNHPAIDWDNYVVEIEKVKKKFKPKVDAIRDWINASSSENLKQRSRVYTDHLNKWLPRKNISFKVRVKFVIEAAAQNITFVADANPDDGFRFLWDDDGSVDQTLFIKEKTWAAVLEGKILLTNLQWASQNQEHVPFRLEIAHFWFWFETHVDLNNRNAQALVDSALHPHIRDRIRPQLGVFNMESEWDRSWL